MIIAQQKRQENIAEYLLYMWQVEDLLRACHLDIDMVEKTIIARYDVDENTRHEIKEWYESLIKMMELEGVRERGHIRVCHNVLSCNCVPRCPRRNVPVNWRLVLMPSTG